MQNITNLLDRFPLSPKMPVLFLGHGSPMNAIEDNEFTRTFQSLANEFPTPNAILCISAHWLTKGTKFTAMATPKTIHDFGGFPPEMYAVQYPAPGSPELAELGQELLKPNHTELDDLWGLDHGAWSVIKHLYPNANIPVIQMSIDYAKPARYHFELANQLQQLRERGILIIGSGNIVHNLREVRFDKINEVGFGYDWAIEARAEINKHMTEGNYQPLLHHETQGIAWQKSIPTPDHYFPLIYTLGLKRKGENLSLFNDQLLAGSISMTSVQIG